MRLFVVAIFMATISEISVAEFDTKACEQSVLSKANLLDCQLSFSEGEKILKKTFGFIRHITCFTDLNISKSNVVYAQLRSRNNNRETLLSPHQIDCDIQTKDKHFKIDIIVEPWIQFYNREVSAVRLNVGNVTGVFDFIGKLIVRYGNDPELQEKAKEALNRLLKK